MDHVAPRALRIEDAPRGREEDLSTSTKAGSREALVGGRRRHRRPPSKAEVDGSDEGGATPPIEATFTFIFSVELLLPLFILPRYLSASTRFSHFFVGEGVNAR